MALNWIVPARRVVISTNWESYRTVAQAWRDQLNEHRGRLLQWYRPLAGQGVDLDTGFGEALGAVSRWIRQHFDGVVEADPPEEETPPGETEEDRGHSAALGEDETTVARTPGFPPRLWKGPLRVLLEPPDQPAPEQGTRGEASEPAQLNLHGRNVAVRLTGFREVDQRDAWFLPGDVLEFPVFKFFHRAGISRFQGATFHRRGSFFRGTSVCDREGNSPGNVRLHDNMMAMRFQLMLSAARGAYFSREAVFNPGEFADKANHARLCGENVFARGIIYGGTLGDPLVLQRRETREDPPRYKIVTNQWGEQAHFPFRTGLPHFPQPHGQHRLTRAWSCSPCAKALAFFMVDHRGENSCGWGGVNQQSWNQEPGSNPVVRRSEIDCLWIAPAGGIRERMMDRCGVSSLQELQRRAVGHMFARGAARVVAGSDDEEIIGESRTAATQADEENETPTREVATEGTTEETGETSTGGAATGAGTADVEALLPNGEEVEIPSDYFGQDHVWSAIAVNGHEYSIVCVWPPERLMDEGPTASGPPVTGRNSAYDPITGESCFTRPEERESPPDEVAGPPVEEPESDGAGEAVAPGSARAGEGASSPGASRGTSSYDVYLFEAAGNLYRTGLGGNYYINAFNPRPFRWERVSSSCIRRNRQAGTDFFHIGENNRIRASQNLLSIVRFRDRDLRQVYGDPRAFGPLTLYTRASLVDGQPIDDKVNSDWYPNRAVPFPTMAEALQHDAYLHLDTVSRNMSAAASHLNGLVSSGGGGGLSAAGQAEVRRLGSFRQMVGNTQTALGSQRQQAVRISERRVSELEARFTRSRRATSGGGFDREAERQQRELDDAVRQEGQRERELREAEAALQTARGGAPTFPTPTDMPGSTASARQAEFRRRGDEWRARRNAAQQRVRTASAAHREAITRVRQLRAEPNERALRQARRDHTAAQEAARSPVSETDAENAVFASYARKIRSVMDCLRRET